MPAASSRPNAHSPSPGRPRSALSAPEGTSCGLDCTCADYVGGGGACYQDFNWCNSPEPCNTDADCDNGLICATNDTLATCVPTGSAGLCVLPCVFATTTTTTHHHHGRAHHHNDDPRADHQTTTAAPNTTTTTAGPTTTTGGPTTTTTTTAGPTTTTTTTPPPPGVSVTPARGTVGSTFTLTLVDLPADTEAAITFIPASGAAVPLGTVQTDAGGDASTTRTVPTVVGGNGEVRVVAGGETESADFEVAPRLRITPSSVQHGQTVAAEVSGFGPAESVRIRWLVDGTYVEVGTLTTAADGTGTANVTVPTNAALGANTVRADGTAFAAQTNAVTVSESVPPAVTVDPTRGTVNTNVAYTVANFPANAAGTIVWRRTSGSTIDIGAFQTDGTGAASGTFKVPATPGGAGQVITFASGAVSRTATYEVAPRIKVATGAVGQAVDVSLRGFGRQEQGIRIRWLINGSWVQVATMNASNTGSANQNVTIPTGATVGANSVRADGPQFRAQTNAATVTA